jgi:sialate O-acetylesterase
MRMRLHVFPRIARLARVPGHWAAAAMIFAGGAFAAQLGLPAIFSDGMVLQANTPNRVWGWAAPGDTVQLQAGAQTLTATADADGNWSVQLGALPAGALCEMRITVRAQTAQVMIRDIAVGEVWLGAGQSNMARTLERIPAAQGELRELHDPELRFFQVATIPCATPARDVKGVWKKARPENARQISGVAYYFGKLRRKSGVPVGLVVSAWGGTKLVAWTPVSALEGSVELKPWLDEFATARKRRAQLWPAYLERRAQWEALPRERRGSAPREPLGDKHPDAPGNLFNGMIHPVAGYNIAGVLWYQGESDALPGAWSHPGRYEATLSAMIAGWRQAWRDDTLPFLVVQLPGFKREKPELDWRKLPFEEVFDVDPNGDSAWPVVRQAQANVTRIPRVHLAPTIDIGDPMSLHPDNKAEVGRRLWLVANRFIDGETEAAAFPELIEVNRAGGGIRLKFRHVGAGLMSRIGGPPAGFAVAGTDGIYRVAEARLVQTDLVEVASSIVPDPVSLRYAWGDSPFATLQNSDGLPVAPFALDQIERAR